MFYDTRRSCNVGSIMPWCRIAMLASVEWRHVATECSATAAVLDQTTADFDTMEGTSGLVPLEATKPSWYVNPPPKARQRHQSHAAALSHSMKQIG
eukprot:5240114-Amphidinium_carterae.1